ncbi:MAG: hypothetical protein NZ805_07900 [Armatimonadetes bacterium]|nr:hypothetical protein [Armatimonadota bacterium]MDW8027379.1 hypothetical protein [Armatimonadota bacterium]
MRKKCWVSYPQEWQPMVRHWALMDNKEFSIRLREWNQRGDEKVMAITVGNLDAEIRLLITVPHAHEPAGTAACLNALCQIITGAYLDGSSTDLPIDKIRRKLLVTFVPDSNPQGRSRSPERVWDGSKYDNDAFLKVAFGIASDGSRFGRYPEWLFSEHRPQQVGIIYEQIGNDLWVEPNTSRKSTHSKVIDDLLAEYGYTHYLELHQHETDEAVLLPEWFEELSESEQVKLMNWAQRILSEWKRKGFQIHEKPYIPYVGQERQKFLWDFWVGRWERGDWLCIEVRNNQHSKTGEPTTLEHQLRAMLTALSTTFVWLLSSL